MIACRSHFTKILYSLFGHNVQLEHDVQFRRNVQLEHNSQFGHDVQLDMRIHSQILDINFEHLCPIFDHLFRM